MSDNRIELLDEISNLYIKEKEEQAKAHNLKEKKLAILCVELNVLYLQEKEIIYKDYIQPFVSKHPFLKEHSSLKIIDKLKIENFHTKFLEHIWSPKSLNGSSFLLSFLKVAGIENDWLNTINKNNYTIDLEHYTGYNKKKDLNGKRIDMLLLDHINKWFIVIENKVDSKINHDKTSLRSQLEYYHDYCNCNRDLQDYTATYILLSYNNKNKSYITDGLPWTYVDYYQLFRSILLSDHKNDDIIKDYLKSLFSLLFSNIELEEDYSNSSLYKYQYFYNEILSKIK